MHINPALLTAIGASIGFLVGLTGIGGGALMTPILVLIGVDPLTAISSDLVVSLIMKPIGSAVHLKRGTIDRRIVGWLALGSIPFGFGGAALLDSLGNGADVKHAVKRVLGVALLLALGGMILRGRLAKRRKVDVAHRVRPLATVLLGAVGGLFVGLTSVGSGSLMIVGLMLLYPALENKSLVGTDLAQAIPLVASAALGHVVFGHISMGLAIPLIIGAVPAVYLGARVSSAGTFSWARPLIMSMLVLTSAQLLGASPLQLGVLLILVAGAVGLRGYQVRSRSIAAPLIEASPVT